MENISLEFLLERKTITKAAENKAKEEMASKGADRKAAAADKASGNSEELSKWGKAVWDVISKLNHGAIVKDTFNQSAADGTLQAAAEKGLVDDKKDKQKNESVTYEDFMTQLDEAKVPAFMRNNSARGAAAEIGAKGDSPINKVIDKTNTASDIGKTVRKGLFKLGGKAAKFARGTYGLGTALTAGAAIGDAYKKSNRAPATSGRGAGRGTFNNSSTPGAKLDP